MDFELLLKCLPESTSETSTDSIIQQKQLPHSEFYALTGNSWTRYKMTYAVWLHMNPDSLSREEVE
jgi:hypothetical protein